ncbi:MAG: SIS domain-containing protein [Clostridiales bacterium]|nr:SIS domain-containing protein [Clostridiales bacterium]
MAILPNNEAMIHEIAQEPDLFRHVLRNRKRYTEDFVKIFRKKPIKRIYLVGSGSPSHLSETLRCAAISMLGVEASAPLPSLFLYHDAFNASGAYRPEEMLLICPVESGKTKGPVIAAQKANELRIPVVCTTLDETGILAGLSDVVIKKPSGAEKAPPTTKGHSIGLFILLLCFLEAARETGRMSAEAYAAYDAGFQQMAGNVNANRLQVQEWYRRRQSDVMASERYWFLAYGANYGTATEAVLKFIESHQKPTFAYELEEFLHGPLCAVRPEDVVFFLAAEDCQEKERMLQLYHAMKPDYPNCTLVRSSKDAPADDWDLPLDTCGLPFLNALEYLIPVQVLAYEIADAAGIDVTVWTTQKIRSQMKPGFDR